MSDTGDPRVAEAVAVLARGGLVALPTETVYGLAADARNELAVRGIFRAKGRPGDHPLIVHLADAADAPAWAAAFPADAVRLAEAFWPGPLTLVLRDGGRACPAVTGGHPTIGLRVPAHPLTRAVLERFGGGLAAPSANRFGGVSPTRAAHVAEDLGDAVDLILDGGPCPVGVESTIVDLSRGEPVILRPGGLPREAIIEVLGRDVPVERTSVVAAPGLLASHYAPRAGVVPVSPAEAIPRATALRAAGHKVAILGPEGLATGTDQDILLLPDDPAALGRELFAALRQLDAAGYDLIVAVLPPPDGIGLAVRDRLTRAAAPRPPD